MPVSIKGTGGGGVTLDAGAAASNTTLTLPNVNATVATTTGTLTNPTINGFTGDTSVVNIGSGQIYKDASGNVGIGTSSPAYELDVYKATSAVDYIAGRFVSDPTVSGQSQTWVKFEKASTYGGAIGGYLNQGVNSGLLFGTQNGSATPTERMRLDSSGNLLVGTTSQLGSLSAKINLTFAGTTTSYGVISKPSADNSFHYVFLNAAGAGVGSIATSPSTTTYNTSSDYRLKNSVTPMASGLATVASLKPVTYKWNADNSDGEGFIAHELQAVIPHAVTGAKDAVDKDGSIKPQGVDYSKIVVHLVAAIQELKADLDAAKAEIATLKGAA